VLPKEVRQGLDEDDLVEVVRRDDGVIEIRPLAVIEKSQAWFWTERWQRLEREADEDYAAGRYRLHDSTEEFVSELERHGPVEPAPDLPSDDTQ
jgi:antitoxin MazE